MMYVLKYEMNTYTGYAKEYYHEDPEVLKEIMLWIDTYPFSNCSITNVEQWNGEHDYSFSEENYNKNRKTLNIGCEEMARERALSKLSKEDKEILGL